MEPTKETRDAILKYASKRIAKYAMPKDLEFREELPKTMVGKVAYRVLEEEELAKIAKETEEEKNAPDAAEVNKEKIAEAVKELDIEEGTVTEVNEEVVDDPKLVNDDAFANWIIKVQMSDASELEGLMDAAAYKAFIKE